ncbi:MAG: phosphatidate cytidylyltransferase [Planctomycetota bacterium]
MKGFALLKWRLISASVIVVPLLALVYLDFHYCMGARGVWLLPLALILSVMMVHELLSLWRERPDCPRGWPIHVAAPLVVLGAGFPLILRLPCLGVPIEYSFGAFDPLLLAVVLGIGLVFGSEMSRYAPSGQPSGQSTGRIALSMLVIVYAGLLVGFLVKLRGLGEAAGPDWGMAALLSLVFIAKLSDTAAYFVGRQFGKHKMAPVLSPSKTVEGAVGALLAAGVGGYICHAFLVPALVGQQPERGPLWGWLLFGGLVTVTGMMGDLAESLFKRDARRKDSGGWLPGLGGVLDVLDSVVFAGAPAYFYFASGLIGPVP